MINIWRTKKNINCYINMNSYSTNNNMGLDMTKPVFRVSDKVRLKSVSSATEISYKMEISSAASLDMIISNKGINKGADQSAWMHSLVCTFVVRKPLKTDFLVPRPI